MNEEDQVLSASGITIKEIYTPEDVKDINYDNDLGFAGQPPFTRGVYSSMYRGKVWTIRRLSGFNTPEDTNKLFKEELKLGQTGFSLAPDITTPTGMDCDDPRVKREIGHTGVPISSLQDMETIFEGLPIERIGTYIADRFGGIQTAMYFTIAEKRGLDIKQIRGTTANSLYTWTSCNFMNQLPPHAILRYIVDLIEWCTDYAPKWYPVSLNSYNPREMGITAYQELGGLFATAVEYLDEAKRRGRIPLDKFVKRFTFNLAIHNDFFEEIAKLRAARRMWYKIIKERYGIDDPKCAFMRAHVQTSGSTHTFQEPYNNLIRIAYQALAGALGGAQSIHANGYDEAVCLPTEQSMLLSIRTEQILQYETGVTNTIDPLGGSYYLESLTNELEERAWEFMQEIEDMGGFVRIAENGWIHKLYKDATIDIERRLAFEEIPVVGVNKFRLNRDPYDVPIFKPDPISSVETQIEKLRRLRKERDNAKVAKALERLEEDTRSGENVMPATMEAVQAYATHAEMCNVQHKIYGTWRVPVGL